MVLKRNPKYKPDRELDKNERKARYWLKESERLALALTDGLVTPPEDITKREYLHHRLDKILDKILDLRKDAFELDRDVEIKRTISSGRIKL